MLIKCKIINVVDVILNFSSIEVVIGWQFNVININVSMVLSDVSLVKVNVNIVLIEVGMFKGLFSQDGVSGDVCIGEKNSGIVLDVCNSVNVNWKLIGVVDGVVSVSSYEVVNGRQFNVINDKVMIVEGVVRFVGVDVVVVKIDVVKVLVEIVVLGGLVVQVFVFGDVCFGEKNSGMMLDVCNSVNVNWKIIGVVDGILSVSSVDVVLGRQFYLINLCVLDFEDFVQFVSIGFVFFSECVEVGVVGVVVGNLVKMGMEGGIVVGMFVEVMGKNFIVIGRVVIVFVDFENGFVLGVGVQVGGDIGGVCGGVVIGVGVSVEGGVFNLLVFGMGF